MILHDRKLNFTAYGYFSIDNNLVMSVSNTFFKFKRNIIIMYSTNCSCQNENRRIFSQKKVSQSVEEI